MFLDVQHVQTPELQASHEEKEQLYQQLLESRKIIEQLQAEIETLKDEQTQRLQEAKSATVKTAPLDPTEGLSKFMADLSVKEIELDTVTNQLKQRDAKVAELEDQVKSRELCLEQINVAKEEAQKEENRMKERVTGRPTMKGAKHIIWDDIANTIFKNWFYFTLVQDEIDLIIVVLKDIKGTTNELENKPDLVVDIIKFLNNRTKEELKDLQVNDRTSIVMDAKRVITKRILLQNVETKCHEVMREISTFKNIFSDVIKHGLPSFWNENGDLYPMNNYQKLLEDRRNSDNKFENLDGTLKGKDVVELLAGDFELLHNLKMIFRKLPPPFYEQYTDLDEAVRNLNDHKYLMGKDWKILCQFAKLPLGRQGESSGTHPAP
jgi:hypothetical protein